MNVKQVIIIRRDLGMRRGKEIAQGAHASMEWLRDRIGDVDVDDQFGAPNDDGSTYHEIYLFPHERAWLDGNHAKVTLQVASEAELRELHERARAAGLLAHLVTDHGLTEFAGVHTKTALAIGPNDANAIDAITGALKLY